MSSFVHFIYRSLEYYISTFLSLIPETAISADKKARYMNVHQSIVSGRLMSQNIRRRKNKSVINVPQVCLFLVTSKALLLISKEHCLLLPQTGSCFWVIQPSRTNFQKNKNAFMKTGEIKREVLLQQ